jgi:hypothetical protein
MRFDGELQNNYRMINHLKCYGIKKDKAGNRIHRMNDVLLLCDCYMQKKCKKRKIY